MTKKKTTQKESVQLNLPAKIYFKKKLKCAFSTNEFHFSAGKLDVLAYDRNEKCFHVAEGKLANRTASVGHAVGQLIAYISMLQENGFDFLNRISKEANLFLTDFTNFLENKSIRVCFYIVLPYKQRGEILEPAQLMLGNIGDFGDAIGILSAKKSKCLLDKSAKPISIKIRRKYNPKEFLDSIADKFLSLEIASSFEKRQSQYNNIQFREKNGNPYLHFEVWHKRKRKADKYHNFEVAFHLEWGVSWQKNVRTAKRASRIRRKMAQARGILKKKNYDFKYQPKWGEAWSKVYIERKSKSGVLDADFLDDILEHLKVLSETLTPMLNKINWGRTRKKEQEEQANEVGVKN